MVWHHRRNSIRAYWRQQQGYGKAEALLEKKWPEKYNVAGHSSWAGRLYGKGVPQILSWCRGRIYQGTWGSALFQSIYQPAPGLFASLPMMPEWYFVIGSFVVLSALGILWTPLLWALPLLALAAGTLVVQASVNAVRASFTSRPRSGAIWLGLWGLTTLLHLIQPLARLRGRLRYGLTPWRWNPVQGLVWPWPQVFIMWHEQWRSTTERLQNVEAILRTGGTSVVRGGDYDRWDLEVRGGLFGSARTLMTIEEHGAGKQLIRFRSWPKFAKKGLTLIGLCTTLAVGAALDAAWPSALILGCGVVLLASRAFQECAGALATILHALRRVKAEDV
jgi:O-antigen biosynthesis protein